MVKFDQVICMPLHKYCLRSHVFKHVHGYYTGEMVIASQSIIESGEILLPHTVSKLSKQNLLSQNAA